MNNMLQKHNTQQHIYDKLIEKAKEQLSASNLSVSEIAYQIGFEHLQFFSKLFKAKTKFHYWNSDNRSIEVANIMKWTNIRIDNYWKIILPIIFLFL